MYHSGFPAFILATLCAHLLCLAPLSAVPARPTVAPSDAINPLIGDDSFVTTFGRAPTRNDAEAVRIRTHLQYAEQLLRERNVDHLSPKLRAARRRNLDRLHAYWTRGIFPANEDYPGERRPCFIDSRGRICAVGYLVEQSVGREVAEAVAARHRYDRIRDMNMPELDAWVAQSGLTLDEAATIQPGYYRPLPFIHVGPVGGILAPLHVDYRAADYDGNPAAPIDAGIGLGYYAGLGVELAPALFQGNEMTATRSNRIGMLFTIAYANASTSLRHEHPASGALNSRPPMIYTARITMESVMLDALGTYALSQGDRLDLCLTVGPSVNLRLADSRREELRRTDGLMFPPDPAYLLENGGETAVLSNGEIIDADDTRIGVKGGLRLRFKWVTNMVIGATLLYDYGLTDITRNEPWRRHGWQLGFDVARNIYFR